MSNLRPSPSPSTRLLSLLSARLRAPLLSSLLLLPVLPSSQANLIFELLPLYRSSKALLTISSRPHNLGPLQQWLAYWLLYTIVRLLEATRLELDGPASNLGMTELQGLVQILPRFLYSLVKIRSTSRSLPALPPRPPSPPRKRKRTLATQLAGTPLRWTAFKFVLLFYAMDEELQGARWILEKLVRPVVGFFTGLEDTVAGERGSGSSSKSAFRRHKEHVHDEGEGHEAEEMHTPELSLETDSSSSSGSSGGRSISSNSVALLSHLGVDNTIHWKDVISAQVSALSNAAVALGSAAHHGGGQVKRDARLDGLVVVEEGNHWVQ